MKNLNVVIALALAAAAPLASADTAQLELLPRVGGAESIQYAANVATSGMVPGNEVFFAHTGGVSPL